MSPEPNHQREPGDVDEARPARRMRRVFAEVQVPADLDAELSAMALIATVMRSQPPDACTRILAWATDRFTR